MVFCVVVPESWQDRGTAGENRQAPVSYQESRGMLRISTTVFHQMFRLFEDLLEFSTATFETLC